jgi:hypothetical protein
LRGVQPPANLEDVKAGTVRSAAAAIVGALLVLAGDRAADAQEPSAPGTAAAPVSVPLRLLPFGEPTTANSLAPTLAVLPLRLSLLGNAYSIAGAIPGDPCHQGELVAANPTAWVFPWQQATYVALTPRLVLHGFSRLGCPLDAGAGTALTYSIPLPHNLWLVASAGAFGQPGYPGPTRVRGDARLDLMMRPNADHAYAVGIGRRGLTFTGTW